jgi:thioredoxin 1
MSNLIQLNDGDLNEVVTNSDVPVLVDFSASWCGPCKVLTPIVEKLANELEGKVKVCKVDIDEAPEAASRYSIRGVPTVIAFKGGQPVGQTVGLVTKDKLLALLDK